MDNNLNYREILEALKSKREWIEQAIVNIERLARDEGSLREKPPAWFAGNAGGAPSTAKAGAAKKRTMSAAGRKKIGDATRKRWADKRAADAASTRKAGAKSSAKKAPAKAV